MFKSAHRFVLPRVDLHVAVARAAVGEGLVAVVALVGADVHVDADVPGEIGLLDELLGTVGTAVARPSVDKHVLLERVPPLEKNGQC